ncbi:MAG: bifunctional FO biosynthesis protein CofGH [Actinomycetota bacterium]
MNGRFDEALALGVAGDDLPVGHIVALLAGAREGRLDDLLAAARAVRDRCHSRTITYSRNVFIPLTRLCRNACGYCAFSFRSDPCGSGAGGPGVQEPSLSGTASAYLELQEVLDIARTGASAGCKEALFTMGDRPEARHPEARRWLDRHGHASTLDYVRAMAVAVIEDTGLLPHLNPGVLSYEEMARLKPVSASMGLMLESVSERLCRPGGPHHGCPDKQPRVRLRAIENAGRLSIPFTTGILVGIGESLEERAGALVALAALARDYGHIQEVIVQNFRAQPGTPMAGASEPIEEEMLAAVAAARLVLGADAGVQTPPNLFGGAFERLLDAGINDWGGVSAVTCDHVNPGAAWPEIEDLDRRTAAKGFELRERLAIYPAYLRMADQFLAGPMRDPVLRLAGLDGLAAAGIRPQPVIWRDPVFTPTSLRAVAGVHEGPGKRAVLRRGLRPDASIVFGDMAGLRVCEKTGTSKLRRAVSPEIKSVLAKAEAGKGGSLSDAECLALFAAEGAEMEALVRVADGLRSEQAGGDITYVINQNINFTNVCYTGCRFCAFAQRRGDPDAYTLSVDEIASQSEAAWRAGATEVCVQGGLHPDAPATIHFDITRAIKARAPGIHIHGFSPMEVMAGATRLGISFEEWLTEARDAGLGSIPGTAAEILDDEVRWVLTRGKLPSDDWEAIVKTAHRLDVPSTATIMYGHVDTPVHWVAHLKRIRRIQLETGGITEFVPLPFVHSNAPIYLAGKARPGPTRDENRCMHAMARVMLGDVIANVQSSWVKLGLSGAGEMLRGGANDFGGTLMGERISRMAGADNGVGMSPSEIEHAIRSVGRIPAERTTLYERISR